MGEIFDKEKIFEILATVPDPEIPVINVVELGIIRDVIIENGHVTIEATPTYSGCPATDVIKTDIIVTLKANGVENLSFHYSLDPPWTTEWISDEGRRKLREYGISIKEKGSVDKKALFSEEKNVECPRCNSLNTKMISLHGSTPCKSLYQCVDCKEPFDYFKCH